MRFALLIGIWVGWVVLDFDVSSMLCLGLLGFLQALHDFVQVYFFCAHDAV